MVTELKSPLPTAGSITFVSLFFTALLVSGCGGAQCPVCPSESLEQMPLEAADEPTESTTTESIPQEPIDEISSLERLFTVSPVSQDWFAQNFLDAVPMPKVEKLVSGLRLELGAFSSASKVGDKYEAKFEKGVIPCSVALDDNGRFSGLMLHPPRLHTATFDDAAAMFDALEGKLSVLVVDESGNDLYSKQPNLPLAVGSAFKLAVLNAVNERIGKKKGMWKKAITLQSKHKSLPSGRLQEWPDGSELTISTLANLMISISDNTATDTLIDWVGRERVEKHSNRNKPFLSTREAFVLKTNEKLIGRYRSADEKERREILGEIASMPIPAIGDFDDKISSDVEWFFNARELCESIKKVAHLPAMQINPGFADKKDFDSMAFKGGSESGVLNFTTWVKKGDRSACVIATWNSDKKIDTRDLSKPYRTLVAATRSHLETK